MCEALRYPILVDTTIRQVAKLAGKGQESDYTNRIWTWLTDVFGVPISNREESDQLIALHFLTVVDETLDSIVRIPQVVKTRQPAELAIRIRW